MKRILAILSVLLIVGLMVGCISGPKEKPVATAKPAATPAPTPPPPPPPQIIEHKNTDFGGNVPEWVTKTAMDLEAEKTYADYYVFVEDQSGKDLQGVQLWANKFVINDAIAGMVSNRVKSKFVGAAAGDADQLETYMEQVVKSVSEADFSGVRVIDKFWVKKRYFKQDGEVDYEEYRYLFLVTVPKKAINDAIKRAFEDTPKPETKEEKSAADRVSEAWGEGL